MNTKPIPWGIIPPGETQISQENPDMAYLLKREETILRIIHQKDQSCEILQNFIIGNDRTICLEPALPELPVVIRPQEKLTIIPGQKIEVFVEIPLMYSITMGRKYHKKILWEQLSTHLSKSFFGNPDTGELAYSLLSPLHTSLVEYENFHNSAYCLLTINNRSWGILNFERMILRVPNLSLYYEEKRILASPVSISFKGPDQISQVNIQKKMPDSDSNTTLASLPRQAEEKSVIKKSFFFLKNLYDG